MYIDFDALEELPGAYLSHLSNSDLVPAWSITGECSKLNNSSDRIRSRLWEFSSIRPLLMQISELAPFINPDERALLFCNPGYEPEHVLTAASLNVRLRLVLPFETLRWDENAQLLLRIVIEGRGYLTSYAGERISVEPGDVLVGNSERCTPNELNCEEPLICLDILSVHSNKKKNELNGYRCGHAETINALSEVSPEDSAIHIESVTVSASGFPVFKIPPGESVVLRKSRVSTLIVVLNGEGYTSGELISKKWKAFDTFVLPKNSYMKLLNSSPNSVANLLLIEDRL